MMALGYMSPAVETTDEQDEKIQLHADKLYHKMLDYEKSVKEAQENDDPIPPLRSVFDESKPAPNIADLKVPSSLEKKMKKPLKKMSPQEQELAVAAWNSEKAASTGYTPLLEKFWSDAGEKKQKHHEVLVRVFGDTVGNWLVDDQVYLTPKKDQDKTQEKE